jgi:hypothetical protein
VINENAPGNSQLTSPEIQKDIVQACAEEITHVIMSELGNACFSLLVDESRDVSVKEQMAVMVRLVILSQFFLILPQLNYHTLTILICYCL